MENMENPFEEQSMPDEKIEEKSFYEGSLSSEEKDELSFFTKKIMETENLEDQELWMKKLISNLFKKRLGDKLEKEGKKVIKEGGKREKGFLEIPGKHQWMESATEKEEEKSLIISQLIKGSGRKISSEKITIDREQIEKIKEELLSEIKSWKNA